MKNFFFLMSSFLGVLCFFSTAEALPQESMDGTWIQQLPFPYNQLSSVLPFKDHGWYYNAKSMTSLVNKYHPKVVVELGSWLGKSTIHIAKLLPKGGKVYAVDHWKGSSEHQTPGSDGYFLLPTLYEQFLSNVIHAKLTDKIIPWRMTTVEAAQQISRERIPVDLVYVDASHDEQSVYQDLKDWFSFVKGHGILCGDDWGWESVRKAVGRFARENNLRIESSGNFWVLYEKCI